MNKYKRKLDSIRDYVDWLVGIQEGSVLDKDFKILQEMVDKETPKYAIVSSDNSGYCCPVCSRKVGQFVPFYCNYCGQKLRRLDWGNNER